MAEPDQPDSESVTSSESANSTESVTSSESGTSAESGTPSAATPVRPMRSAPLRRGTKKQPSTPDSDTAAETTEDTAEAEADAAEADAAEADTGEADTGDQETGPDPSELERSRGYRDRRLPRTRSADTSKDSAVAYRGRSVVPLRAIVLAVSVVVIVACTVVAVLAAVGIARHDTKDRLRAEYSDFASQVIVNLTSFSPKTTDNALKTLEQQTSGRARTQISDSIEQVTSLVKSTNVETKTTVLSSAVTNATADEGSVIMVYGWEQRSLDGKAAPEYQTFRWRVDMTRINGQLKMTNFEWVT